MRQRMRRRALLTSSHAIVRELPIVPHRLYCRLALLRLRPHLSIALRNTFTRHRLPHRTLPTMVSVRCLSMRKTCHGRTFGGYMASSGGRTVRLGSETSLLTLWK
jgi:hypothetical protein